MRWAWAAFLIGSVAAAQIQLNEIKLSTEPADARVRPLETASIQVRAYGELTKKDGAKISGRIARGGAALRLATPTGGWISKPFRFQGRETEAFLREEQSGFMNILRGAATEAVIMDSFLYSAPQAPGDYVVEASLDDKSASLTIHVALDAPVRLAPESVSFPAEPASTDPYRRLAGHWSPMLAQETWFHPRADYPARFDYDGDWHGDNNWDSLPKGSSQAYVYYAAMETRSHWFLVYNIFHPRDYSDRCLAGSCHENDNEGLILTVLKDGSEFGRLQTMETLAHNNLYSYVADDRIRNGAHRIDGRVEIHEGSHPVAFIESGGHGVYGSRSTYSRYSLAEDSFSHGTGVTFVFKGAAERPKHAGDRRVSYELLSIRDHWWVRAHPDSGWSSRTFDEFFVYRPVGGRPGVPFRMIAGAFLGRKEAPNKARPFWGWFDTLTRKRRILADGQWGLDPAYAVSRNLRFPEPFSLEYVFNPYLGIGE